MDKVDVFRTMIDCQAKLEEAYDLWSKIPMPMLAEFERLFMRDEGVRYHIYRAMENLKDIHSRDVDKVFETCDGGSL